jgi:hypothetical protein
MLRFDASITFGQVLAISVTLAAGILGSYVHTQIRMSLLEQEVSIVRKELDVYKDLQTQISNSLIRIETNQLHQMSEQNAFKKQIETIDANIQELYKRK